MTTSYHATYGDTFEVFAILRNGDVQAEEWSNAAAALEDVGTLVVADAQVIIVTDPSGRIIQRIQSGGDGVELDELFRRALHDPLPSAA
jgi:hypothetical protein